MSRINMFNVSNVSRAVSRVESRAESRVESRADSPVRRSRLNSSISSCSSSCGNTSFSSSCGTPCATPFQPIEDIGLHTFDNPRSIIPQGNVMIDRIRLEHLEYIERNLSTIIAFGVQNAIEHDDGGYTESSCPEE